MSKQEKTAPVTIVWWKLITVLVTFAIACLIVLWVISSYMKTMAA